MTRFRKVNFAGIEKRTGRVIDLNVANRCFIENFSEILDVPSTRYIGHCCGFRRIDV